MTIVKNISLLLLALWLGAATFFSVVVAPAAFSVLRTFQVSNATEIAGAIVNRSLAVVNISGFVIAALLLLLAVAFRSSYGHRSFLLQATLLAVVALMTGLGHWVIAARMHALRSAMALPIDQLAANDSRRIAFNSLHRFSVSALTAAVIAALIACLLSIRNARLN